MKNFLVVTITCSDRPGIVERVTDVVVTHGGNWEESRLARLGGDFAGIVHDVSAYLAKQGINVETMETGVVPAPMTATPLFYMQARLDVPPSLTIDELRENLLLIAEQLGVSIDVVPAQEQP